MRYVCSFHLLFESYWLDLIALEWGYFPYCYLYWLDLNLYLPMTWWPSCRIIPHPGLSIGGRIISVSYRRSRTWSMCEFTVLHIGCSSCRMYWQTRCSSWGRGILVFICGVLGCGLVFLMDRKFIDELYQKRVVERIDMVLLVFLGESVGSIESRYDATNTSWNLSSSYWFFVSECIWSRWSSIKNFIVQCQ